MKEEEMFAKGAKLSAEREKKALTDIRAVLPGFCSGDRTTLVELERFLFEKYGAEKVDWRDIDRCTRTKVKRYNKYCRTVFCVSEGHVADEEYRAAYIVKRDNLRNPSVNEDDFFYDLFLIVGSEDGEKPTSYFIGGYSEGLHEEIYVLCGNR